MHPVCFWLLLSPVVIWIWLPYQSITVPQLQSKQRLLVKGRPGPGRGGWMVKPGFGHTRNMIWNACPIPSRLMTASLQRSAYSLHFSNSPPHPCQFRQDNVALLPKKVKQGTRESIRSRSPWVSHFFVQFLVGLRVNSLTQIHTPLSVTSEWTWWGLHMLKGHLYMLFFMGPMG